MSYDKRAECGSCPNRTEFGYCKTTVCIKPTETSNIVIHTEPPYDCPASRQEVTVAGAQVMIKPTFTNQHNLARMTPEECYNTIYWLFNMYSWQWNDSRQAIIKWLQEETNNESNVAEKSSILPKTIVLHDKPGKWSEVNSQFFGPMYECSNCKRWSNIETAFCPHCGIKMDL